jgi:hypothetical protein
MTTPRRMRALQWVVLLLLSGSAVGAQVLSDGLLVRYTPEQTVQWVRSPAVMRRLVLGFDTLAADLYWIRAVQYYGSTKPSITTWISRTAIPRPDSTQTTSGRPTAAEWAQAQSVSH